MTNKEFIKAYVNGSKAKAINGHLGFDGDFLINYSTVICVVDREKKTALVNKRRYSSTTSKIMGAVRYELHTNGYTITEFDGSDFTPWNYGYLGAGNTESNDIEYAIEKYNRL